MCGIAGFQILKDKNNSNFNCLERINNVIRHRGPDNSGYWKSELNNVFLAHQRLSIIDLSSSASQPMISNNKRYIISFNGEIYNYRDLIKKNKILFKEKNINSDTRVLLELISFYGVQKTAEMVNGMFAFCVWDKEDKVFHLVRDRFGEKPLFYYLGKDEFIFGSEIKVISEFFSPKKLQVNNNAFNFFFSLGYIPGPITVYKKVFKVLPSEIVTIKKGKIINKRRYWSRKSDKFSEKISVDEVKNSLEHSVESMMVADVEVGCFLSGGIDSSIVASIMQKKSRRRIKTFSIGFKEREYDESQHAGEIAKYLKTDHHEMILSIDDLLNKVSLISKIYDEPFGDSSCLPTLLVSEFANKHVKVCLSGDGGDEIFLGYNRYKVAQSFENLIFSRSIFKKYFIKFLKMFPLGFYDFISYPVSKAFGLQALSHRVQKIINILDSNNYVDFYARLNSMDVKLITFLINEFQKYVEHLDKKNFIEVIQFFDLEYYLPNDILVKVDRASMNNSLEVRSPFLDHKLFEKVINIPIPRKLVGGVTKSILKDILSSYIPKHLFDRPKMGFAIPLNRWIFSKELKTSIDDVIYETKWENCKINKKVIINTWDRFKKYKFCPPSLIWNYYVAGMWINQRV